MATQVDRLKRTCRNGVQWCLSKSDIENQADVGHVGASQILENGNKIQQLVVMGVRKPTADGHCVLRVEDVGSGRVVDNDGVLEVASDLRKVLHIVSLVVVATLAEEAVVNDFVYIQLVQQGIAILIRRQHSRVCVRSEGGRLTFDTDAVKTTTS